MRGAEIRYPAPTTKRKASLLTTYTVDHCSARVFSIVGHMPMFCLRSRLASPIPISRKYSIQVPGPMIFVYALENGYQFVGVAQPLA